MPLYADDVSEYVAPQKPEVARLVVDIQSTPAPGDRRNVTAQVDHEPPFTGWFAVPDWVQAAGVSRKSASKVQLRADDPTAPIGEQLFSALFSSGLSRCWAQAVDRAHLKGGLHVVIRSEDLVVQALPWELLSDPLASGVSIARVDGWSVVRELPTSPLPGAVGAGVPAPVQDLRIAVVTADMGEVNQGGVPQGNDPKIIQNAFAGAKVETFPDIRREKLQRALARHSWSLVHVLATGGRSRQGKLALLLSPPTNPDIVTVPDFVEDLQKADELPRLVVLAACESDLFAAELARTVPNVIGMRGMISDEGCMAFLRGLYKALGSGSTIDQAVAAGRAQQLGFSRALADEWALPVLFLTDPTPLASVQHGDAEERPEPTPPVPSGNAEDEADRVLLEMSMSNLASLRSQWDGVEDKNLPKFVRDQIDGLAGEVDRLTKGRSR